MTLYDSSNLTREHIIYLLVPLFENFNLKTQLLGWARLRDQVSYREGSFLTCNQ